MPERCVCGEPVRCPQGEALYLQWRKLWRLGYHDASKREPAAKAEELFLAHVLGCSRVIADNPELKAAITGLTAVEVNRLLFERWLGEAGAETDAEADRAS